jgi:hypothetical protein
MEREKLKAVLKLLKSSVDSNLNAALSPDDCRLLLNVMAGAQRAARGTQIVKETPPPAPPARNNPVDRIVEGIAELGKSFLDDLTDDIRPRRRKRR